jgi:hypothetical protein
MQTSIAAGAAHKGAGQADLTVPLCMVLSIKGKRLEIYSGSHTLEGGNSHPRSAAMPPHGRSLLAPTIAAVGFSIRLGDTLSFN